MVERTRWLMIAIAGSIALGCTSDDGAGGGDPTPLVHAFESFVIEPGQESIGYCQSWTLGNEETLYVNAVEMTAGFGFHHSNWFWVPERLMDGPDGSWRCSDRNYSEAAAGLAGGVLFAQSTQARSEVQQFPEGVVIPIPPRSRIVGGVHLLNASGEPLESRIELTLHPIHERDVVTRLSGLALQHQGLAIQPKGTSTFSVACDIRQEHERQLGRAPDFSVYYVMPHYHHLGRRLAVHAFDATSETVIFETESDIGEPLGGQLDPLFDMTGWDGVRLECEFANPDDQVVGWGIGDQEMCIFLAFTDAELNIAGGVSSPTAIDPNPTVVDGVTHFRNDCVFITAPPNR